MVQKERSLHLMGTVIDLMVEHEEADLILDEVSRRLKMYKNRFSANDKDSELMEVNKNAGLKAVAVHPELYQLIKIGKHHSLEPGSLLNIAIGPLVQSWRIGFDDAKVPSKKEIDELLKKIDPRNIVLDDESQTVYLMKTDMSIDLGALAKGYIADLIIDYLRSRGVRSALINLGGNLLTLGPSPKRKIQEWKIGIQDPHLERNEYLAVLTSYDQSVVTSGIYERHLETEEEHYHHILDPQTGFPVSTDVASLSIVSQKSLDGEIWTTRLFGKDSEEIIDQLNRLEGINGVIVTKSGQVCWSKELDNKMTVYQ